MQVSDAEALEAIAFNLRRLRGQRSLADIAREIGTFPANVARIERGEHMPGVGLLTRLATALGATVENMLVLPPKKNRQKSAEALLHR